MNLYVLLWESTPLLYMYFRTGIFMFACAIILTVVFTVVTTKFVRGFIGEAKDLSLIQIGSSDKDLSPLEHKALRNTAIAAVIYLALLVIICIPQNSVFRADDGSLVPNSPLLKSVLITVIFILYGYRELPMDVQLVL